MRAGIAACVEAYYFLICKVGRSTMGSCIVRYRIEVLALRVHYVFGMLGSL